MRVCASFCVACALAALPARAEAPAEPIPELPEQSLVVTGTRRLLRGASSALYGSDALAGVVNLISRRPKRAFEAAGYAQFGQLHQSLAGATLGGKHGNFAGTASVSWFGSDSYDLTPGDPDLSTN